MNKKWSTSTIIISLLLSLLLTGCNTTTPYLEVQTDNIEVANESKRIVGYEQEESESLYSTSKLVIEEPAGEIFVRFIDVGQGDSCVIVTPNNDIILIDAGDSKDASEIIQGLGNYTFEDIDLMILSHPHADHIGGATTLLNTYDTKEIVMSSYPATTKTFETLLNTVEEKDVKLTQGLPGLIYNIDGVIVEVLASDTIVNDSNNSSLLVKVTYGSIDILFTGDIEVGAESIILEQGVNVEAEILKVSHHGSDTSTSDEFLNRVNPTLSIISVGRNNQYNHPSMTILEKLKSKNIQYYRTDEIGSIELEIDGENIISNLIDSVEIQNFKSSLFLFAPTVAEVHLEDENIVIEDVNSKIKK